MLGYSYMLKAQGEKKKVKFSCSGKKSNLGAYKNFWP